MSLAMISSTPIVPRSPLAAAHGDGSVFGFLVAQHEHVRDLVHLRLANLKADLLVAQIQLAADAQAVQLFGDGPWARRRRGLVIVITFTCVG